MKKKKKKDDSAATGKLPLEKLAEKQMTADDVHAAIAAPHPGLDLDVLGHPRAVLIVCACADTSPRNLPRTLDELGVNGISFQKCVFSGVEKAGYFIKIDEIPDSGDTTLIAAAIVIQNAPRAE